MTERTQLATEAGRIPLAILRLMEKAPSEGLTSAERTLLEQYAGNAPGDLDPAMTDYLSYLLDTAPTAPEPGSDLFGSLMDAPNALGGAIFGTEGPSQGRMATNTPGFDYDTVGRTVAEGFFPGSTPAAAQTTTAPSVADQVNMSQERNQIETATPTYTPGAGDLRSQIAAQQAGNATVAHAENAALNTGPRPFGLAGTGLGALPPDQGGGRDRINERGPREDWKVQRDAIMGAPVGTLPEGSAFADIDPGLLPGFAANPELAAQQIARSRGGGAASASILAPQLSAAMGLDAAGVLSGGRQLGGGRGAGDRLALSEAFVNSMGPGDYVNPQPVYKQSLRNANRTPVEQMFTGEGDPGDITNQIEVTNGALAASANYMAPDAADALAGQLQSAADEYILGVANGEIDPATMTYPLWLKTEKKAKRWVSRGLSPEQIASAF